MILCYNSGMNKAKLNQRTVLHSYIDKELYLWFVQFCDSCGIKMSALIREFIESLREEGKSDTITVN